ncbi:MAG: T9SS type A sorting domain-containing protein [Flavobacteriales bacterium]|nr:T9SS type A sorting domain-containing protein [Flavobacteriales bacterium]
MRTVPIILLLSLCLCDHLRAQVLISDSLLEDLSVQDLIGEGIGNAETGIRTYKLRYWTTDAHDDPIMASGAMVVPNDDSCHHALACYMHGTILEKEGVPSRLSNEIAVGHYLGASNYLAVLPDYVGLGDSPGMHPYIHARSEAMASIDLMRAAREWSVQHATLLNGQVFLVGYSQGGHACMATHRLIQQDFADEFHVTASAPCSGPYDASGVQAQVMIDTVPYPAPYYLPYIVLAYRDIYPGLFNSPSEVFKAPWDMLLPPLFDGTHSSGEVDAIMPDVPGQVLQDSVLLAFTNDPQHPFRLALEDNDTYDWAPQANLRMYYCSGDDHVFHQNSIVAEQAMQANGSTHVSTQDMGVLDHGACAFPALLAVKYWFDQQQADCSWDGIAERTVQPWSLSPNPADARCLLRSRGGGQAEWRVMDMAGRVLCGGGVSDEVALPVGRISPGTYIVRVEGNGSSVALPLLVVH